MTMTETMTETITDTQIERLEAEAASAGDLEQVALCRRALDGDEAARAECARVTRDAAAMVDTLSATIGHDTIGVRDAEGGVWWRYADGTASEDSRGNRSEFRLSSLLEED